MSGCGDRKKVGRGGKPAALPNYTQGFVIPSRKSSALNIRPPATVLHQIPSAATATSGLLFESLKSKPPEPKSSQPSRHYAGSDALFSHATQPSTAFQQEAGQKEVGSNSNYDAGSSVPQAPLVQPLPAKPSSNNNSNRHMDIYAVNYIPLWLLAVNDSVATISTSLPLNSLNFGTYISSFAGTDFINSLPPVSVPSIGAIIETPDKISASSYEANFSTHLRNEITAQSTELHSLYLYNVPLAVENPHHHLFRLSVPGVRENAPLIDLGDVIMIRPVLEVVERVAALNARAWYDFGARNSGVLAPGFLGMECHAVVWGISKVNEEVVLRIDGLAPGTVRRCNAIFAVQEHHLTPLFRSIQITKSALEQGSTTSSWMRSMLFPDGSDVKLQHTLPKGSFDVDWINKELNYEQKKAVDAVIGAQYGRVPYLISGPPGTGKTRTIVEITLQLLRKAKGPLHLLVCSPSQSSADTLATRLAAHLTPKELFRLNSWARSFAEVPENLLPYCYNVNDLFSLPPFQKMMSFKVVVVTCRDADLLLQSQLTNSSLRGLLAGTISGLLPKFDLEVQQFIHWNGVLLDEAAQAMEPEALIPLSIVDPGAAHSSTPGTLAQAPPFVVMAGDEHQLGPRLSLKATSGLAVSLFERLMATPFYADHPLSRAKGNVPIRSTMLPIATPTFTNLIRNYRSNPAILSTSSLLFYHDTLVPERRNVSDIVKSWDGWKGLSKWTVLFREISAPDTMESIMAGNGTGAGGLVNPGETQIALTIVKSLLNHSQNRSTLMSVEEPILSEDIVIMSPFRAQVKALRMVFRANALPRVNIGPLESFQGLESRIVILCTTRTRLGPEGNESRFVKEDQLRGLGVIDEPKRFNVAMTRAKEGLIVIGSPRCLTCTGDGAWKAFLAYCQRNGLIEVEEERGWKPDFDATAEPVGRLEKALKYAEAHTEAQAEKQPRFGYPDPALPNSRRLKGQMMTEDEEMWARGMELYPDEIDDNDGEFWPEDHAELDEEDRTKTDTENGESKAGNLVDLFEDSHAADKRGKNDGEPFDRDLVAELEKTDCATQ